MWVAPAVRGRLSATRILPFSVMETAFSHNGGLAAYRQMRSLAAASWAGTMVFASTEKAFGSKRRLSCYIYAIVVEVAHKALVL